VGLDDQYRDHVFLTPSGMSSIYMALRSSRRYQILYNNHQQNHNTNIHHHHHHHHKGGTSIVYGFPYLDTLKLCSRPELSPDGVEFFGTGCQNDLDALQQLLVRYPDKKYCALFTEVPSNPLLQCPDLFQLRQLANQYSFAIVVDDTISNFLNIDVISNGIADIVCTSLTKLVSGRGDVMGGSFICNPNTKIGRWIQQDLLDQQQQQKSHHHINHYNGLHAADANAIVQNSCDFIERNEMINQNAVQLAEWLHSDDCPDVDQVYYPKLNASSVQHYHQVMRQYDENDHHTNNHNRYGGLLSMTLHPHMCQRYFYDALNVAKGPSLGTNFTLVCPYTLLAHYHELDFAMGYNVPPNLLRIAVGLEPFPIIQDKFYHAFNQSRLYPKPIMNTKPKTSFTTTTTTTTTPIASPQPQHQTKRTFYTTSSCNQEIMTKNTTTTTRNMIKKFDPKMNINNYVSKKNVLIRRMIKHIILR
jgi:cystathionine gamma-synthase